MPISSGSQLIKFNIRGPFWSAGASAIRLDTPERHWSYRDLLVDISPLSAAQSGCAAAARHAPSSALRGQGAGHPQPGSRSDL